MTTGSCRKPSAAFRGLHRLSTNKPSTNDQMILSTIPGSLQVIPGEYHQLQPPVFFCQASESFIQNRTNWARLSV